MKHSLITTFLLFLFATTVSAQVYRVDWGAEYRRSGGIFSDFFLVGMTDEAYHMLLYTRKESTLFSYNWDHRLIDTKSVAFSTGRDDMMLGDFIRTRSGNFAVLRQYDRRAKQLKTFVSRFANQSFTELQQISAQPTNSRTATLILNNTQQTPNIFAPLVTSPDYNKVLFTSTNIGRSRNEPERIGVQVYDRDFTELWSKAYLLPYADDDAQIIQSVVSNAGEVYLLAKIRKRGAERRQSAGLPDYRYELCKITSNGETQRQDVNLGGDLAPQYSGIYIPDSNDEPIIIAGMYTNAERRSNILGAFVIEVTQQDFTFGEARTSGFSQAFLEDLVTARAQRRGTGLENDFLIRSFFRFADGKLGFIAEETYITREVDPVGMNNNVTRFRDVFHTDELVVLIFNNDGNLVAMQKIDKDYNSYTPNMTSFATAVANDQLFIVYNDQKSRRERKEIRGKGGGRVLFTDLTVISNEGYIDYQQSLFTSDMTARKSFIAQQSDYNADYMVLLARSAKFFQCGLMRLR